MHAKDHALLPDGGHPHAAQITKNDRLVVELKLPHPDAFFKLRHVIDEVNSFVRTCPSHCDFVFALELGNVVFAIPTYAFSFTLQSFAIKYVCTQPLQPCPCSHCVSQIPARSQG